HKASVVAGDRQFDAVGGEEGFGELDGVAVGVFVEGAGGQHDGAGGEAEQRQHGGVGVAGGDGGGAAQVVRDAVAGGRGGDRAGGGKGVGEAVETGSVEPVGGTGQRPSVGFGQRVELQHRCAGSDAEDVGDDGVGWNDRCGEQAVVAVARLTFEIGREPGAAAHRVGDAAAVLDEGAASLLGAQHAFLHQGCDGAAYRVAVDAERFGERDFGRQLFALGELPGGDGVADTV